MKLIKQLLQKQILTTEKKNILLNILNYLEYQYLENKDDIYLENEIKILYDSLYE